MNMENLSDADFKRTMLSALRLLAIITVVRRGGSLVWLEAGAGPAPRCCWSARSSPARASTSGCAS